MIRRPPRSTQSRSSAASDVYKRQALLGLRLPVRGGGLLRRAGAGSRNARGLTELLRGQQRWFGFIDPKWRVMMTDVMTKPHQLIASDRVEGTAVRRPGGERLGHIERLMICLLYTSPSP